MKRGRRSSSSSRFVSSFVSGVSSFVSSFASSVPRDRGRSLLRPGGRVARRRRRRRPRAAVYGFALFAVFGGDDDLVFGVVRRSRRRLRARPVDLGSLRAETPPGRARGGIERARESGGGDEGRRSVPERSYLARARTSGNASPRPSATKSGGQGRSPPARRPRAWTRDRTIARRGRARGNARRTRGTCWRRARARARRRRGGVAAGTVPRRTRLERILPAAWR